MAKKYCVLTFDFLLACPSIDNPLSRHTESRAAWDVLAHSDVRARRRMAYGVVGGGGALSFFVV